MLRPRNEKMEKIALIIADPDPKFAQEVTAELQVAKDIEIVAVVGDWQKLPKACETAQPVTIIFGPGWGNERVLTAWLHLKQNYSLNAIYLTTTINAELESKAKEFIGLLTVPVEPQELIKQIRLAAKERQRLKGQKQALTSKGDAGTAAGRVVTIFSPKGGVGKTVLATNLAISFATKTKQQISLVDGDLQFGDISVMLKLKPAYTIADLTNSSKLDKEKLFSVLTNYQDLVDVLAAPLQPQQADLIAPELLAASVQLLKASSAYVFIDTPPSFDDHVLTILDHTDLLLLVATLDLPCLKNVKLCLKTLHLLGFPKEQLKLVLNRVESGLGIDQLDVQKVFQEKVLAEVANDPAVTLAVNQGKPVVLAAPKTIASQQILNLGEALKQHLSEVVFPTPNIVSV